MRPAFKTALASRQAGEHAARLLAWVEQNGTLLAHHGPALRDDIESLMLDLAVTGQAVEAPPCVGFIGSLGSRPQEIVAALIGKAVAASISELETSDATEALPMAVLDGDGNATSCAVMRYAAAAGSAASRDFPIACTLLGEPDIIKILARAYLAHVPASRCELPSAAEIGALFTELTRRLSSDAVPGASRREIIDLREHLHAHHPRSRILGALAATGYWDRLAEMVSHLGPADRLRAFSALWRGEPVFTGLCERLSRCLERLGPGLEICCAPEAMLEASGRRGTFGRHPRCITDAATLLALGATESDPVRVVNRYGKEAAIGRAELAALTAEMAVEWSPSRHSALEATRILLFPSPNPVAELPLALYMRPAKSPVSLGALARFFAHIKSSYLFERACRRGEVTSLVVPVDPNAPEDETLAPLIGDWIELAQGSDATLRERTKTALFVIETKPGQPRVGDPVLKAAAPADWDERLGAIIAGGLGCDQDWPREWTPGRPFDNVFAFEYPPLPTPGIGERGAKDGSSQPRAAERDNVLAMPILFRRVDGMRTSRGSRSVHAPGTASFINDALLPVAGVPSKTRQIEMHVGELRRRLRGRLRRHHLSNDPARTAEWRRQVANVAQSRLQRCAESGRLGHLLEALTVGEAEFAIFFRGLSSRGPAEDVISPSSEATSGASLSPLHGGGELAVVADTEVATCERFAAEAVAFWACAARQKIRSLRLCRQIRVPQSVLQHVVDEVTIGAGRVGLSAKLADAFLKAKAGCGRDEEMALRFATYATRIIGAFVESLDTGNRRREILISSDRLAEGGGAGSDVVAATQAPNIPARLSGKSFADLWCNRFSTLVEANIAAAPLLAGTMEKDRELGEILSLLISTPAEVEL